jgi:DNA replication protein DnaC
MDSDNYQQRLSHLLACGAPEMEAEVVAAGANETTATKGVRDFIKSPATFCLVMGGAGSGKTVAAVEALLSSRVRWGANGENWAYSPSEARFLLATDLARLSYFDSEALKVLDRAERVKMLLLDDVGGELMTDTWKSNFTELILRRNSARRKTLLTTNLPADVFKARYDERIISRIRGNGVVIVSGNDDMRRPVLSVVKDEAAK